MGQIKPKSTHDLLTWKHKCCLRLKAEGNISVWRFNPSFNTHACWHVCFLNPIQNCSVIPFTSNEIYTSSCRKTRWLLWTIKNLYDGKTELVLFRSRIYIYLCNRIGLGHPLNHRKTITLLLGMPGTLDSCPSIPSFLDH